MRPGHGGTISRLCAYRRDHSDVRRPHRERARHRGGAARGLVARRVTERHAFAVPALARADRCTVSWHCGLHGAPRPIIPLTRHGPAALWWTVSGSSSSSTPATGSRTLRRRASTFRPSSMPSSCRSLPSGQITAPRSEALAGRLRGTGYGLQAWTVRVTFNELAERELNDAALPQVSSGSPSSNGRLRLSIIEPWPRRP